MQHCLVHRNAVPKNEVIWKLSAAAAALSMMSQNDVFFESVQMLSLASVIVLGQ